MRKLLRFILSAILTLAPTLAYAQTPGSIVTNGAGAPTLAVADGSTYTDTVTGLIWTRTGGVWKLPTKQTLTSTYTVSSSTFTNIPGLSLPVAANTNYAYLCYLVFQVSSTSTIPQIKFTGPASPTSVFYSSLWQVAASSSPNFSGQAASAFGTAQGASPTAATTNLAILVHLGLLNGANAGTIQLQGASPVTGTFTVQAASWCAVQ